MTEMARVIALCARLGVARHKARTGGVLFDLD